MVRPRSRWWSGEGSYFKIYALYTGPGLGGEVEREVIPGALPYAQDKFKMVKWTGKIFQEDIIIAGTKFI